MGKTPNPPEGCSEASCDAPSWIFSRFCRMHFSEHYGCLRPEQQEEWKQEFEQILKPLTYREKEIIKLRTGLGDGYSYTLEEVGRIFKVTRERIRQVEAKAIRKLKPSGRRERLDALLA